MINKKELKKLMWQVAKGVISEKDAQDIIKGEKTPQNKPQGHRNVSKDTHKRKKQLNKIGGK